MHDMVLKHVKLISFEILCVCSAACQH